METVNVFKSLLNPREFVLTENPWDEQRIDSLTEDERAQQFNCCKCLYNSSKHRVIIRKLVGYFFIRINPAIITKNENSSFSMFYSFPYFYSKATDITTCLQLLLSVKSFQFVGEIKVKVTQQLMTIPQDDFSDDFEQLKRGSVKGTQADIYFVYANALLPQVGNCTP